jgi:hypothetical protein
MNRRAFLFVGLLGPAVLGPARAASGLQVIYVGGWDCEPCLRWKNAYKATWFESAEFKQVTWVEIEAPKLKEAYQERYWPDDLQAVLKQLPRKRGTPRFLIVKDGQVVSNQFGVSHWQQTMADLKQLLG